MAEEEIYIVGFRAKQRPAGQALLYLELEGRDFGVQVLAHIPIVTVTGVPDGMDIRVYGMSAVSQEYDVFFFVLRIFRSTTQAAQLLTDPQFDTFKPPLAAHDVHGDLIVTFVIPESLDPVFHVVQLQYDVRVSLQAAFEPF